MNKNSQRLMFEFLNKNGDWVELTNKLNGEFLAVETIKRNMGGLNVLMNMLGLDEKKKKKKKKKI